MTLEPSRPFPDRMAQDNDELIGEGRASTPNPIEHLLGGHSEITGIYALLFSLRFRALHL